MGDLEGVRAVDVKTDRMNGCPDGYGRIYDLQFGPGRQWKEGSEEGLCLTRRFVIEPSRFLKLK